MIFFDMELTLKDFKNFVVFNQDKDKNILLPVDWVYELIEKAEEGERYKKDYK